MKKSLAFPLFFSMTLIFRSVSGQLVDIAPGLLTPGQDGASEWEVWNEPSQEGRVDTTRDVPDRGAYEQANSGQYQYPAGLQQQYGQPQAPAQAPQAGLADIAWNYPQQAANPAQPYNPAPAQNIQPQLQPAPAQSIQPEQPVQSIQHEQPAQSIQPQQPVQSIQPQQPVQSIQPQQPVQSIQPQQPVQSIQPQQPVQSIQPQQPVQSIQPQQPAQSLQPQQPFQSNQPQQPEQSIQPQQPVQSIQPNEQSAPAQGSQPDQQSYQTAAPNSPVQVNQVLNPSDRVNLPAQQPVVVNIHLPSQKDDSDEEEYEDDEDYEDEEEYEDEDYEYNDEEEDYESSGDEDEDGWEDSSSSREHDAQKVVPKKKMRVYRVRLQKQWNPHMLAVVYSLFVTAAFILFIGLCLSYNRDRVSRWILRRKHGYTHVPVKEESKKLLSDTIADL